jgi:hypothetical protein
MRELMSRVIVSCVVLLLLDRGEAMAQSRRPPPMDPPMSGEWTQLFPAYQGRLQRMAAGVSRDGFIVARVVEAVGVLHDFQVNVAIQRSIDIVEVAHKRAVQDPVAPYEILRTIESVQALLAHAREQGSAVDLELLTKEIFDKTKSIQLILFREVDALSRERAQLSELEGKLMQSSQLLDAAMVEALSSTFEYVRAGGK